MKVEILEPSGCCQGVNNAIFLALKARSEHKDKNVYILGMLVHNETVINELTKHHIETIIAPTLFDALNKVNDGVVIFTAHGHDEKLNALATNKGLIVYDSTCAFVKVNHHHIQNAIKDNHQVIFIGKKNHPETDASLAISPEVILYDIKDGLDYKKVIDQEPVIVCQTTLSIYEVKDIQEDIYKHFPKAKALKSVCNATYERQKALNNISSSCDLILIVGSNNSSNTSKLYEISKKLYKDKEIRQIKTVKDLFDSNLDKYHYITIVGGASTPKSVLEEIKEYLLTK